MVSPFGLWLRREAEPAFMGETRRARDGRSARLSLRPQTESIVSFLMEAQDACGDDPALETLWRRFRGELERFIRSRVKDPATTEDLLQTAFLRAYGRLREGEKPLHPRAWLYQITRNLVIDAQRSEQRSLALAERLEVEPSIRDPGDDATDTVFELVARALPIFIDQLDEPYRRALVLTELQGLTQAEAARLEGVSLSGMKSRVQRGRKRVYEALTRCCRFEVDRRGRVLAATPRRPAGCMAACSDKRSSDPSA